MIKRYQNPKNQFRTPALHCMRTPEGTDPALILFLTNIFTWNEAPFFQESFMLFWISSVSSGSPIQWFYIILPSKISAQRLLGSLRLLVGLTEENVVVISLYISYSPAQPMTCQYFLIRFNFCPIRFFLPQLTPRGFLRMVRTSAVFVQNVFEISLK